LGEGRDGRHDDVGWRYDAPVSVRPNPPRRLPHRLGAALRVGGGSGHLEGHHGDVVDRGDGVLLDGDKVRVPDRGPGPGPSLPTSEGVQPPAAKKAGKRLCAGIPPPTKPYKPCVG